MKRIKFKASKSSMLILLIFYIILLVPNQYSGSQLQITQTIENSNNISTINQEFVTTNLITTNIVKAVEAIPIKPMASFGEILLMHSDRGGVADIESMLFKDHGITTRSMEITAYVPQLNELLDFPLIFIWTYESVEFPIKIGDILADYVDSGGSVIMASFSYSDPDFDIEGRFFTEEYSPFTKHGSTNVFREYDRTSTHPIFNNVSGFASTLTSEPVGITKNATLVASFTDGVPFVALDGQVIGMSAYPNPNYWDGDYDIIISNAINYLLSNNEILLLYADLPITAQNISQLITPFGYNVDMLDVSTIIPNLASISKYSVIISWSFDKGPVDRDIWGNLMADYIDSGGSLIMLAYTYYATTFTIRGRFAEEGYSPLKYAEGDRVAKSYSGTSLHPIFNNVSEYKTTEGLATEIASDAYPLAYYDDDTIFAALRRSVIGINSYIPLNLGGNIDQLLANSIDFLLRGVPYNSIQPTIQSPNNQEIEEGSTGNMLSWTIAGPNPYLYVLSEDGNIIRSGLWTSGEIIAINIDGLTLGDHEYIMTAYEQTGNSDGKLSTITVVDTSIPVITHPNDILMSYDDSSNITWVITDSHPGEYFVTLDGNQQSRDNWTSGQEITIFISHLIVGEYTFVINATDSSGNSAIDSVNVSISALTVPTISNPMDMYIVEGDFGQKITWYIEDDNPSFYQLNVNGQKIGNSSWIGLSYIEVYLDSYLSGNYNFTLTLKDESNHIVTDTVMVQIYIRATTNDGTVTPKSSGGEIIDLRQIAPVVIGSILALGLISFFRRR